MSTVKDFSYHFKKTYLEDDEGQRIGEGKKHPNVKVGIPVPEVSEVIEALQTGGKVADMIMDSVYDTIFQAGKGQIKEFRDENPDAEFTADKFDLSQLTLEAIANAPGGRSRGVEISKEDWKEFYNDYQDVMSRAYEAKRIPTHISIFKTELRKVRNDKPVLERLVDFLNVWASKTENMEDHQSCYERLLNNANRFMKQEPKNILEAL